MKINKSQINIFYDELGNEYILVSNNGTDCVFRTDEDSKYECTVMVIDFVADAGGFSKEILITIDDNGDIKELIRYVKL